MIIRAARPDSGFLIVRNEVVRDTRLSYRARGVLVAILSRPDNWVTSAEALTEGGTEGRDATRRALAELSDAGYIKRVQVQDERGRWVTQTVVYDMPQHSESQEPMTGNPPSVNPPSVVQSLKEENRQEEPIALSRKRLVRRPKNWQPTEKHQAFATANGLDLERELEQFCSYHDSKGSTFVSWEAAFRTWLGNATKYGPRRPVESVRPRGMPSTW